jgi:hypothetical protein
MAARGEDGNEAEDDTETSKEFRTPRDIADDEDGCQDSEWHMEDSEQPITRQ